jgi:hypothetical protein
MSLELRTSYPVRKSIKVVLKEITMSKKNEKSTNLLTTSMPVDSKAFNHQWQTIILQMDEMLCPLVEWAHSTLLAP